MNFIIQLTKHFSILLLFIIISSATCFANSPNFSYIKNPQLYRQNFSHQQYKGRIIIKLKDHQSSGLHTKSLNSSFSLPSELNTLIQKKHLPQPNKLINSSPPQTNNFQPFGLEQQDTLSQLNNYLTIEVPSSEVLAILDELASLDIAEVAYPEMQLIPASTPDFKYKQAYHNDLYHGGLDINYAREFTGGYGENATIEVLEVYNFNFDHEDLDISKDTVNCPNNIPNSNFHATATAGVIKATDNGYGVTGIAPRTNFLACSDGFSSPIVLIDVILSLKQGDIILLEAQTHDLHPIELEPVYYDLISLANSLNIIVIEPAGNGDYNLDDPIYSGLFDRQQFDSGAIMVGGGTPYHPQYYSFNYGNRVDVQGWGTYVTTTSGGDLYGELFGNNAYTDSYNGTSSASAMIAGFTTLIQSLYSANFNHQKLTPAQMRFLLTNTGIPQQFDAYKHIGPQPNIRNALNFLNIGSPRPPLAQLPINQTFGKATKLGGNQDNSQTGYIRIPPINTFNGNSWTLEFWVHKNYLTFNNSTLFIVDDRDNLNGQFWTFSLNSYQIGIPSILDFFASVPNPYTSVSITSQNYIPLRKWVHIALVKNNNTYSLYLNGKRDKGASSTLALNLNVPMAIGGTTWQNQITNQFPGLIDEFRLSTITRYTGESFVTPSTPFTPDSNTSILYHFDNITGNQITDFSGNNNHATIIGNVGLTDSTVLKPECGPNLHTNNKINFLDLFSFFQQKLWNCFQNDCTADQNLDNQVSHPDYKYHLQNYTAQCPTF